MCNTCGCNITPGNEHLAHRKDAQGNDAVTVLKDLLSANNKVAAHNREHFDRHGVLALNLMSAPGSGKTLLLEATIEALKHEFRIGVIEGDLETENDAARIRAKGVRAGQSSPAPDLVLLTKPDLLPVLDDFDPARAELCLRQLANPAPMLRLSAKKKDGLDAWFDWLRHELAAQRPTARHGQTLHPAVQPDGARMHARMAQHHRPLYARV